MKKITTLTEGGKKSNGEEDRYRQAESHEGKLNSLVNVSNQGANLPGIGRLSRTAH